MNATGYTFHAIFLLVVVAVLLSLRKTSVSDDDDSNYPMGLLTLIV